jgi:hypothetical protein
MMINNCLRLRCVDGDSDTQKPHKLANRSALRVRPCFGVP